MKKCTTHHYACSCINRKLIKLLQDLIDNDYIDDDFQSEEIVALRKKARKLIKDIKLVEEIHDKTNK